MNKPTDTIRRLKPELRNHVVSLAVLAVLTLAMFADVLFTNQAIVPAYSKTDLFLQFIQWRRFGFEQLRQGNLALWNPHLYSGVPFFGGFQPALLYPLNLVFLILPLAKAISWSIALHIYLSGAFMYGWAVSRRLHPLACFLSAVMYMFCGPNFFHIYGGHLPHLCAMAWMPCLFLSVDRLFEKPSLGWMLIGGGVVAMLVLAGQPQYLFYAALGAGIYSLLLLAKAPERKKTFLGLTAIVIGGAGLSAIQLLTGMVQATEMGRGASVPYDFAAMFSFPPENFLTLLAPGFFGDMRSFPYWGRCYLWEVSLFLSVTGMTLAVYGAVTGEPRRRRFSAVMVPLMLLLALGAHTPLFKLLYHYAPGFDQFRGNAKFIFLASLFLALLAGVGLDRVLQCRRIPMPLVAGALGAGIFSGAAALWLYRSASASAPETWWSKVLAAIPPTGESYFPVKAYTDPEFVLQAGQHAARALLWAGGILLLLGILFFLTRRSYKVVFAIALLAVVEMLVFAHRALDRFDVHEADLPEVREFLARHPGDYRILNLVLPPNSAMILPAWDIWGMDFSTLRYGQTMAFAQGADPDHTALEYLSINRDSPFLKMLRCRFVIVSIPQAGQLNVHEIEGTLPHLQLVSRCRILTNRNEIFNALTNAAFNPREEVILESAPQPTPQPVNATGTVKLVDSGTDYLDLEAEVPSACILLVTDSYAKGWRARALSDSGQRDYQVMPANYCLRAIPLAAGRHHLRIEYRPTEFLIGRWVSLITLVVFLGIGVWCVRRRRSPNQGH